MLKFTTQEDCGIRLSLQQSSWENVFVEVIPVEETIARVILYNAFNTLMECVIKHKNCKEIPTITLRNTLLVTANEEAGRKPVRCDTNCSDRVTSY